jgi:hypothetical protein
MIPLLSKMRARALATIVAYFDAPPLCDVPPRLSVEVFMELADTKVNTVDKELSYFAHEGILAAYSITVIGGKKLWTDYELTGNFTQGRLVNKIRSGIHKFSFIQGLDFERILDQQRKKVQIMFGEDHGW